MHVLSLINNSQIVEWFKTRKKKVNADKSANVDLSIGHTVFLNPTKNLVPFKAFLRSQLFQNFYSKDEA